jgi:hypothetical protein
VYAYETMVSMDAILDSCNDKQVLSFTDADCRNHLAFLELSSYEKDKVFLYVHPLLQAYKLEIELNQLRIVDPEKFMNQTVNLSNNITRYQSKINNNKYKDDDEKAGWLSIIKDCQLKLSIIKSILSK